MSAQRPRLFRFASEAQWQACLFESAQHLPSARGSRIRPHALYGGTPVRLESAGAQAPALLEGDELLWRDGSGRLHRWFEQLQRAETTGAYGALAHAARIVPGAGRLWAAGDAPDSLQCFDTRTYTRILTLDLAPAQILDLAPDGRGGVFVLLEDAAAFQWLHVDGAGRPAEPVSLHRAKPKQLAWLRHERRMVTLSADCTLLHWHAAGRPTPEREVPLNWPRPCFHAQWLAADSGDRILVAGIDGESFGEGAYLLVLDAEGRTLEQVRLEAPATGLAARRGRVLVSTERAVLRYSAGTTVPDDAAQAQCTLLTPALRSPGTDPLRRWLRAEVKAALPAGTALEVSYASSEDKALIAEAGKIARNAAVSPADRLRELRARLDGWRTVVLEGSSATATLSEESAPLSAPLFEVRDSHLWLCLTLRAAAGAPLPELAALEVLYGAPTLMDSLPAVYRREEAKPDSFLRALVGVLESTTQSIDARIASIGTQASPHSATDRWLDFTARWLGLPWSDALDEAQKRAVMLHAAALASGRGTRAGLETLLEALLPAAPGEPRRFRIVDVAVDLGLAIAGSAGCPGSALPAVIAGLPRSALVLNKQAEIGRARLPCPGAPQEDIATRLLGHVRVDVAASAEERGRWEPWLASLLSEMLPATLRLRLRWISPASLRRGDRLDGTLELVDRPAPRLGTDAIPGLARLPAAAPLGLPSSIDPGSRLH